MMRVWTMSLILLLLAPGSACAQIPVGTPARIATWEWWLMQDKVQSLQKEVYSLRSDLEDAKRKIEERIKELESKQRIVGELLLKDIEKERRQDSLPKQP